MKRRRGPDEPRSRLNLGKNMQHRRRVQSLLFTLLFAAGTMACGEETAVVVIEDEPDFAVRILPEEGEGASDAGTIPTWGDEDDDEDADDELPADDAAQDPNAPLTCNEIFTCFGGCDNGDQACIDDCFERGTPTSQNAVSAIGACVRENGCQDNACVETHCAAEIRTCDADDGAGSGTPSAPNAPSDPVDPAPSPAPWRGRWRRTTNASARSRPLQCVLSARAPFAAFRAS